MKKRILSLLLILCMVVTFLNTAAFAVETTGTLSENSGKQQPSPEEQLDAAAGTPVRTPAAAAIYVKDDGSDTDDGYLVSVAIPKALVGLTGKASFKLRPALVDYADAKKKDATLTGGSMSTTNAAHWPQVMLDS